MARGDRTRLLYLDAMGIQAWSLRVAVPFGGADETMEGDDETARIDAVANPLQSQTVDESRPFPLGEGRVRAEALDRSTASSDATGASALTSTPAQESIHKTTATGRAGRLHPPAVAVDVSPSGTWEELHAEVVACQSCPLHRTRTQTVFGVGDRQAQWMVIGEAPGEQEDLQGEPFVGRAGLLLNEMIRAIGLLREQVYIANILKCRPPGNRDPQVDEVAACESFLMRQLALVRPSIILAVGRIAAQQLLKTTTPIGKLRGSVHDYQGVPLVVTYHPAYLLRSPLEKRKAWDDLCLALRTSRTS